VILNYNGADLLPQCLPSIVLAASKARHPTRVTLLDNGSTDSGLAYTAQHFPQVDIVKAPANRILCSYNDYLPQMQEPVALLLNNDIRVDEDFVDPLIEKFEQDPSAFLVAPRVMSFDGTKIEAARSKAGLRWGLFWCNARYPGYEQEASQPSETFSSGFGAISREKFLTLGGYDDRYLPGIYEDVDLCFRAQKAGYHLYYEPKSVVYHMGQATFKREFGSYKTAVMAQRNSFLFMWKNYSGAAFWFSHFFFLPFRLLFSLLKGRLDMIQGFFEALKRQCCAAK
jgi:N-acetylglucosaminyl-diphospho-decaprenol L-rhamnosyltransferase